MNEGGKKRRKEEWEGVRREEKRNEGMKAI